MRYFYWVLQTIIWPISWLILRVFFRFEIHGKENIKGLKGPLIIISNHIAFYDAFLIGGVLPWFSFLFPLRFMGETKKLNHPVVEFLRKIGLIRLIFFITGVFPSKRGEGIEAAIKIPVGILSRGGTVVMFPEGRVNKQGKVMEFRHGATALARASGANVLPIALRPDGRKIILKIGVPFKLQEEKLELGTVFLREKVEGLFLA